MTPGNAPEAPISPLHDRLRIVAGERPFRVIAEITGYHAETVRRYLSGHEPSIEFVCALCRAFDISADWMLTGRGAMHASEARKHALRTSSTGDLLGAIAGAFERMSERVDRIERYVQTLETRLRAREAPEPPIVTTAAPDAPQEPPKRPRRTTAGPRPGGITPPKPSPGVQFAHAEANPVIRALWIAGALPERSRPDAH